jgi:cob(I)alamin adenosyltransferase
MLLVVIYFQFAIQNPDLESMEKIDKKIEIRHGLTVVYTGNGKGKTTAALGTVIRAVGYGLRVFMLQFVKGSWHYGELDGAKLLAPYFTIEPMGKGFYKILDDKLPEEEHRKAAMAAADRAIAILRSRVYDMIILDEINVAVMTGLLPVEKVLEIIEAKPENVHLILTGRGAPPEVIDRADLVTEMKEIKHPFQKGKLAQKGIDF